MVRYTPRAEHSFSKRGYSWKSSNKLQKYTSNRKHNSHDYRRPTSFGQTPFSSSQGFFDQLGDFQEVRFFWRLCKSSLYPKSIDESSNFLKVSSVKRCRYYSARSAVAGRV